MAVQEEEAPARLTWAGYLEHTTAQLDLASSRTRSERFRISPPLPNDGQRE